MLKRFFVIGSLFSGILLSTSSFANETFNNYVADLYLNESHQARNPDQLIRYGNDEKGKLLKSVLDPERSKAAISTYYEASKRGERLTDITRVMQPLVKRYDTAFKKDPKIYENEYLDTLEAMIAIISPTLKMMDEATLNLQSNNSKSDTNKDKALMESLNSLAKSARSMTAMAHKAVVSDLRANIAKGLFSKEGAQRAEELASRLETK
jgi:hypothetical protein